MTQAVQVAQYGSNNVGLSFKNRIINGDMRIDQRNAGASIPLSSGSSLWTLDRWAVSLFGTTYANPAMTAQKVSDAPDGFTSSIKILSSATNTPDANKLGSFINQPIEGLNFSDMAWGTANAQPITISFRVKASKTGNVSVSIENNARDRSYVTTVAISSAGTWETKSVTIPGDTTGTWLTTNGIGADVKFGVMSNGSWLAGAGGSWSSTRYVLSTSQTNFIAASGDYLEITGVQLEKGSVATSFDYRPYGTELSLCERYYEVGTEEISLASGPNGASNVCVHFRQKKRSIPTCTATSSFNIGTATSVDNISLWKGGSQSATVVWTASAEL